MSKARVRIVDVKPDRLMELPCCGIKNVAHEGHIAKTAWLRQHLKKGLRAKVLVGEEGRQCGYIEYLPGEHACRAVDAAGYMFIHCIWTFYKKYQRQGHAKRLVRICIEDARKAGMNGVAVVARKKPWLAGSDLFSRCGFAVVDTAPPDYELLASRFTGCAPLPKLRSISTDVLKKYAEGLTIVRSDQCPHAVKFAREIAEFARSEYGLAPRIVVPRSMRVAPTPYAVFSIIYDGQILADHQISRTRFRNIMQKLLAQEPRTFHASTRLLSPPVKQVNVWDVHYLYIKRHK